MKMVQEGQCYQDVNEIKYNATELLREISKMTFRGVSKNDRNAGRDI